MPFLFFKPKTELEKSAQLPFSGALLEAGRSDPDSVLASAQSSNKGLSEEEAEARLAQYGLNEVIHEKPHPWWLQLLATFKNPFSILLIVLAGISFATDDTAGGVLISAMVLVSVFLTFYQEFRSNRAAERLKAMVTNTATTIRQNEAGQPEKKEVPLQKIVPGDLIQLSAGDMVPADVRLISSKDLFVGQAALTGEALPIEKTPVKVTGEGRNPLEFSCLCFMGSNVVSGTATAVVLHTGGNTYFGSLAKSIVGTRVLTSFEKGVNRFTWLMLRFMMVMVPIVFFINGFFKHQWLEAFTFAVAVAVGLTPEMLPMIVTVNLAKGALAMSRKKVIVKRLNSIQNFGAMNVLCTDKTGTLTQNKVVLLRCVDPYGFKNDGVFKYAFLNSYYQTGLKNLLDVAVLDHVATLPARIQESDYRKIDEIPFDFLRRRMSVVVEEKGQRHILVCKGALEEIFQVSTQVEVDGDIVAIDQELKDEFGRVTKELNEDGLRVLAVAYKEMPADHSEYSVKDESNLILLGYLAFLDPPKETTAQAIALLNKHGVRVKVLTGDNDVVTRKICRQVGIPVDGILLGPEIEAMSEEAFVERVEACSVFAKLSPSQKERIVRAMHQKGHVVGFLGDGINDAPALRAADVGISVDNAVDIAKESADIILLEKSLLVLEEGVIEGRKVFGNIIKYIKMGASSNFGNVFSVVGASLLLPFLPMLPVQLLFQNLLYDLSQTAIPLDRVDEEYLSKPRRWEIGDIGRFMVFIGPLSSIFDYTTFALMWFVFGANNPAKQSLFQSGWFVEGLLSQTLIVHLIRTAKIPFLQSVASWPLVLTTLLIMSIGIWVPFSPLAPKISMLPLPGTYFPWLVVTLVCYALLTQMVKSWYIKKYGYQ